MTQPIYMTMKEYIDDTNKKILMQNPYPLSDLYCVIDPKLEYASENEQINVKLCNSIYPLGITQSRVGGIPQDLASTYTSSSTINTKINPVTDAGEFIKRFVGGPDKKRGRDAWVATGNEYCRSWGKQYDENTSKCRDGIV